MSYDFSQLNDKEFENLSIDILSEYYEKKIERFKSGKDKGVDGRFFSDSGREVIIQCKHYLKSGYKLLISKLTKDELIKVQKLNPVSYILVTSLTLSRDNKKQIKNIFHPFILNENDIWGQEDINDLISKNNKIEDKYFKLWISSTNVLNKFLNNAIIGRSEFEFSQIKIRSKKYVETQNHINAIKKINEKNVLIITGEPGIGKTTLAENICLHYIAKEYEFRDIQETISEAENVYKRGEKQIFYFDDFLGSNYIEAIENKKDTHIVKFIERIKNDNTKKLILTSRTNILNSGILNSSVFSTKKIKNDEYLISIQNYNNFDKAKILYNHIWFSNLNEDYIEEIYKEKRYKNVIVHKNFNPRLIELVTDNDRVEVPASEYWNFIKSTLDNPKEIWNNCFKNQNNQFVRILVKLVVFNGGQIEENELIESYNFYIESFSIINESNAEKDFKSMIQIAVKSFLNRFISGNQFYYNLFNPSISDFILNTYCDNIHELKKIYKSLFTYKSLKTLKSLNKNKFISSEKFNEIMEDLFYNRINHQGDYLILLCEYFINDVEKQNEILFILNNLIKKPEPFTQISIFLKLLMDVYTDKKYEDFNFILSTINSRYLYRDELIEITNFIQHFQINDSILISKIEKEIESFIDIELDGLKNDLDLSNFVEYYEDNDGIHTNYDESEIREDLEKNILGILNDFNPDFMDKSIIDIYTLISKVDFKSLILKYIDSRNDDNDIYYENRENELNYDIFVDDLFERS